jgi:hypothetical protein
MEAITRLLSLFQLRFCLRNNCISSSNKQQQLVQVRLAQVVLRSCGTMGGLVPKMRMQMRHLLIYSSRRNDGYIGGWHPANSATPMRSTFHFVFHNPSPSPPSPLDNAFFYQLRTHLGASLTVQQLCMSDLPFLLVCGRHNEFYDTSTFPRRLDIAALWCGSGRLTSFSLLLRTRTV